MNKDQFEFEFILCGLRYRCHATCLRDGLHFQYAIEFTLNGQAGPCSRIFVRPALNDSENWHFTCENGENAACHYPLTLLERFGVEVDKHNLQSLI
ncbi:hypothetical protein [Puia dinghuensis]|uniref:Uncharacterized protein n=1 Tax=Puia dinghuensis TaxID=1792502 RepID=A0A8J2UGR0_9BACT|nr:hypothetical protein [Puia dinghuensis]GGB14810.1 hypothetical protein GCM10011511_43200 [Puia dinghuensis]